MKTAEQWRIEIKDNDCMAFNGSLDRCIKAIQNDARISALEEAAKVAKPTYIDCEDCGQVAQFAMGVASDRILSLAAKLKEGRE